MSSSWPSAIFTLISLYFFVPLAAGLVGLVASRRRSAPAAKALCFVLVGIGFAGAVQGAPYWFSKYQFEREERAYFDRACRERSMVQLPVRPISAEGVIWVDADLARQSFLSNRDVYSDWVDPGRGRYLALEMPTDDGQAFNSTRWDASRAGADRPVTTYAKVSSPTLPFTVRTASVATREDQRHGVDGIETTITETGSGQVVARRVVLGRYPPYANRWALPEQTCPAGTLKEADCNINGCSVLDFVLTAVPPVPPHEAKAAYDLYRGGGARFVGCSFGVHIGPSVGHDDIEWWIDDQPDKGSMHIRIKGTGDQVTCNNMLAPSPTTVPKLWFASDTVREGTAR